MLGWHPVTNQRTHGTHQVLVEAAIILSCGSPSSPTEGLKMVVFSDKRHQTKHLGFYDFRQSINRRLGVYQAVGTDQSTFAVVSLGGKFGELQACGATCSHILPLPNSFAKSFAFRSKIEKEGLPRGSTPALGAGGPEFKSRRPVHSFQSDPSNFSASARHGESAWLRGRSHLKFIAFAKGGLHCAVLLASRINIGAHLKVESAPPRIHSSTAARTSRAFSPRNFFRLARPG